MRTSHIPACQRANEDTYCGGWWDRGNGTLPWPSALWESFFLAKMSFNFSVLFLEKPFSLSMDTTLLR